MLSHRNICLHGHFYQPPRENPWLEEIEHQESAHPFHDWNARIHAECYRANSLARTLDAEGRLIGLVNNYAKISFNFGPTLLSWMERFDPDTYARILKGDADSLENFGGHGGAIAQVYNHMIMPLANRRDKETQIIWGLRDFESRFRRKPESMWLAETAVDFETLEFMAAQGLKYVILAPRQALAVRAPAENDWQDVTDGSIDPRRPYRIVLPNGQEIAAFFYDGPVSRGVAFEGLLHNGGDFSGRMVEHFAHSDLAQILPVATDGESYGHHHRHGEMALAYAIHDLEDRQRATLASFGEYLARHEPRWDVRIAENSSWSCIHGIERWRNDCGCNAGTNSEWNQQWRRPLRQALDTLRDSLAQPFEDFMRQYAGDPWLMRNDYISLVLDRSDGNRERFLTQWCGYDLPTREQERILKAMEAQRNLMLMYTSCGWFFDEISGIETVQNLKYACRAIHLAKEVFGVDLEENFIKNLEAIPSNIADLGNGKIIYESYVLPARIDLLRVAAHAGMLSALGQRVADLYCYRIEITDERYFDRKERTFFCACLKVTSCITTEEKEIDFAASWAQPYGFTAWVRLHQDDFNGIVAQEFSGHSSGDTFRASGFSVFTIAQFFKDQQEFITGLSLSQAEEEIREKFHDMHQRQQGLLQCLSENHMGVPESLRDMEFYAVSRQIAALIKAPEIDANAVKSSIDFAARIGFEIDSDLIASACLSSIRSCLAALTEAENDLDSLRRLKALIACVSVFPFPVELQDAQDSFYLWRRSATEKPQARAEEWKDMVREISEMLRVSGDA